MRSTSVYFLALILSNTSWGARLKDIAALRGARDNQLTGYGLVVGLSGTGDKGFDLTNTSLAQVLKSLGVDPKTQKFESKNAAAVVVTATLPAFARNGQRLDVTISSVGSATSLDGGSLMMTALRAPDGQVYAVAQGKVLTQKRDGNGAKSTGQSMVTAQVPSGALIEREVAIDFTTQKDLRYQLLVADFTTAARVARRINEELGGKYATATDAGTVDVIFPYNFEGSPVDLIAQLENIDVEADRRAKVVINQRTGTVILGDQVKVLPVAIAHNNLKLEVKEEVRTPSSAEGGATESTATKTKTHRLMVLPRGTNIADVVGSLNEMGASADDLVTLMQSLKASGALMAELEMQ